MQLIDVVRRAGWPTVDELKGRFVFVLSGTEAWKKRYAELTTPASLCFADFDVADDKSFEALAPTLPANRVFVNMHVFSADFAAWKLSVPRLGQAGYIVRAYVLDAKAIWGKALAAGVNVLATDEVRGKTWAHVGAEPFEPV